MGNIVSGMSGIVSEDVLNNGREMFKIPITSKRKRLVALCGPKFRKKISRGSFYERMRNFDVNIVRRREEFPDVNEDCYDCRDWIFDNIRLPQYTSREGGIKADALIRADFSDIIFIPEPEEKAVVMYFDGLMAEHWGVVKSVGRDVRVYSKWGGADLFEHSLCSVPEYFGSHAMFFKKVD